MSHIHKEGGSKYSRLLYKYHITYGCLSLFFYDLLAADIGHYKVYSINHGNQRQSQKYILIDIFIPHHIDHTHQSLYSEYCVDRGHRQRYQEIYGNLL